MKNKPFLRRFLALAMALLLTGCLMPTVLAVGNSGNGLDESTPVSGAPPEEPSKTPPEVAPEATVSTTEPAEEPLDDPTEPPEEADSGDCAEPGTIEALLVQSIAPASTAAGSTVSVVGRNDLSTYGTKYSLYYKLSSGDWWEWGSYYLNAITYFTLSDARTAYCIEPTNTNHPNGTTRTPLNWGEIQTKWGKFEWEKQQGIALALLYGAPNNGKISEAAHFATAAMVWDMACGYYDYATGELRACTGGTAAWGEALRKNDAAAYAEYQSILAKIKKHGVIPSFTADRLSSAEAYTMVYDDAKGLYTLSLTDTNGVLESFNYQSTLNGLSFQKDGNTLNITATPEAASSMNDTAVSITSRGHDVTIGPDVCTVWQSGDTQLVVTLDSALDPVPSYFKLQAEVPDGSLTIEKASTNGAGSDQEFTFGVFRNISGPEYEQITRCKLKVGESVTLTDLVPGLYLVREYLADIDGWECTNADQTASRMYDWINLTVPAGGSVTVTANNEPTMGTGKFIKSTSTGANLGGWTINIYTDEACTQLYTSVVTGTDGTVSADFPSGTYYAKEAATDDPYWVCDSRIVRFVITPGATTQVRFENTHMGKIRLVKTTSDGSNLTGWQFELYRDAACTDLAGSYVSAGDGTVTTENLPPAVYYAKETGNIDPEISALYACAEGVQAVTVEAGKTAEVTLRSGSKAFSRKLNCLRTSGSS